MRISLKSQKKQMIIAGNFNTNPELWESKKVDKRGELLCEQRLHSRKRKDEGLWEHSRNWDKEKNQWYKLRSTIECRTQDNERYLEEKTKSYKEKTLLVKRESIWDESTS